MGNLSQEVGKNLVQPTINITKKKLKNYRQKFQKHKNKIDSSSKESNNIILKLKAISYTNKRLEQMTSQDLARELLKNRKNNKDEIIFEEAAKILEELEKEYKLTYEDINKFRAEFFMPITYSYGFTVDNETYSISDLSFKDIAEFISLDIESRATELDKIYKLRLSPSKEQLRKFMKAHKEKLIVLNKTSEKGETLWGTLDKYREKYNQKGNKYNINKGQMYEVYRSLVKTGKYKNNGSLPPEEEILSKFIEVRKNNLSWTRGGDVEEEQDKFERASITTATSLIKTLNRLIQALRDENLNREKIAEQITKIFGNQNFDSKTKNKARKKAEEELKKEIFANLKIE